MTTSDEPHLLITCIGAYADSGVGTGGFVHVRGNTVTVLDRMDSTGLVRDGHEVYRFTRAQRAIVGYGLRGVHSYLRLPDACDVHDIALQGEEIVCVSTGSNEIHWYDWRGRRRRTWQADGEGDAWHLNCLCRHNGAMYVSAFGEFKRHRGWHPAAPNAGFVMNLDTGAKVLEALNGPHTPRWVEDGWFVCESHVNKVTAQDRNGRRRSIRLDGFTRGMDLNGAWLYVGESAYRKVAVVRDHSFVVVMEPSSLRIVRRIRIPFPEIYEIVCISPELSHAIAEEPEAFQLFPPSDRIRDLERQIDIQLDEYNKVEAQLQSTAIMKAKFALRYVVKTGTPLWLSRFLSKHH